LAPASTFPLLPFCFKCFLLAASYSQTKEEEKNHGEEKKCKEGKEFSFKFMFCPLTFGSRFCPSISNTFFWHLLVFKHKKRKNHKEEKNVEKGGSLPSSFHSAFSLLAFVFGLLLFLPFRFKRFLLAIFFFSSRRKKRKP
jgi:hypothetical protein